MLGLSHRWEVVRRQDAKHANSHHQQSIVLLNLLQLALPQVSAGEVLVEMDMHD